MAKKLVGIFYLVISILLISYFTQILGFNSFSNSKFYISQFSLFFILVCSILLISIIFYWVIKNTLTIAIQNSTDEKFKRKISLLNKSKEILILLPYFYVISLLSQNLEPGSLNSKWMSISPELFLLLFLNSLVINISIIYVSSKFKKRRKILFTLYSVVLIIFSINSIISNIISTNNLNVINFLGIILPYYSYILVCGFIGVWIGINNLITRNPKGVILPNNPISSPLNLAIFILAYNHTSTLPALVDRIPTVSKDSKNEIFVIDDYSKDNTYLLALGIKHKQNLSNMKIYRTKSNQMYGGNQKLGYAKTVLEKFDIVIMLHGDAQYAPEFIPKIIQPIIDGKADMVFGSRMSTEPLKGGMPPIKYIGNKVLTFIENKILDLNLSEFHSGFRAYSVSALEKIPFHLCTNEFHFDTEIIIQMKIAGLRIVEVPISTVYGDETSHVGKFEYGLDIIKELFTYILSKKGIIQSKKYNFQNYHIDLSIFESLLFDNLEEICS